ncbi:acetylornithine deacetylase [Marinobacter sp. 2_MG-2023]|uniref:acetylornithine deacetylase n=1 Tax=Marinobacter sp. 2_MG-2023 TaxID=3062679 RepID=UPI0026E300FA|nr:acetylornithine deacetylase [Marinobacter sp. 2_MG-2023]MDO6441423.1 acetylornithine deacetylase [Marinobacter sp. 2_MG-2023]
MKRLFTTLVLAALLGFAAYKAGVWWLADQRMSEARQALGESGVLERGKIGSGVEGRLVLSGAHWQDFELTQPLVIGRAELDAGSPVALLAALADPSDLPANWSLQAEGLALALEATMFRNWVTADGTGWGEQAALFALPCAPDPRQQLGSGDLLRMGVTRLAGELIVRQTPEHVHLELNTANTGSLEINWPGARINLVTPEATLESSSQPLEVTLRDGGLMRRVAAYCAREAGIDPGQWAGRALGSFEAGLKAYGWRASEQLRALYRQWLLEGGEITATVRPGSETLGIPVRSEDGSADGNQSWTVEYNGAKVPDVFLRKAEPVVVEPPREALEPVVPRENPALTSWHAEDPETSTAWIGRKVRVLLSNGNLVEGRLASVTERQLEIAREVAGGEVAYPIAVRAITEFEVWRRGQAR